MNLLQLLDELPAACGARILRGADSSAERAGSVSEVDIGGIADDSRQVKPGDLFIAVEGADQDGRDYLGKAVEAGAVAALVFFGEYGSGPDGEAALIGDPRIAPHIEAGFPLVAVTDSRLAHVSTAFAFYDHPDRKLSIVGVTGTNGKTTTAALIRQICEGSGRHAADLGTVGVWDRAAKEYRPLMNTTPGPVTLARLMSELAEEGVEILAMEVSSHAIVQKRVENIRFKVAAYTNLSQDHLDYHRTMEEYAAVKTGWLETVATQAEPGTVVVNVDDEVGRAAAENLKKTGAKIVTYGTQKWRQPTLRADGTRPVAGGVRAVWHVGGIPRDLTLSLAGRFNISNALAAIGVCEALGVDPGESLREITWCSPPPGRFEMVAAGQKYPAIVDYAHTPDALENLLSNARDILDGMRGPRQDDEDDRPPAPTWDATSKRIDHGRAAKGESRADDGAEKSAGGRLIVVFGCGGDRDRAKRPIMGKIAARLADIVIVTSDNPRTEDPEAIIDETIAGVESASEKSETDAAPKTTIRLTDRAAAIDEAVRLARPGDVLVVAGKGHEPYQEIQGVRHDFDDRVVLGDALRKFLN